jgi:hypothetical protein
MTMTNYEEGKTVTAISQSDQESDMASSMGGKYHKAPLESKAYKILSKINTQSEIGSSAIRAKEEETNQQKPLLML